MKYSSAFKFLLLNLLTFLFSQCSVKDSNEKLVGEWIDVMYGKKFSIIFDETNHAIFIKDNIVLGGKDFTTPDGVKAEVKYEADEKKNPSTLDIVIYEKDSGKEIGRIMGIFRYLTENKIEWRMNSGDTRFEEFNSKDIDQTAVLERNIVP